MTTLSDAKMPALKNKIAEKDVELKANFGGKTSMKEEKKVEAKKRKTNKRK